MKRDEDNSKLSQTLEKSLGLGAVRVLSDAIQGRELSNRDAMEFYNIFEKENKLSRKRALRLLVIGVLAVLPLLVVNLFSLSLGNTSLVTMLSMLYMVLIMLLILGILLRTIDWIFKNSVLRDIRKYYPTLFHGKEKNF